MKDNFINHNFDKLLLFALVLGTGYLVLHIVHHGEVEQSAIAWAENAFSTVLGALILILTGRIQRAGQDGQSGPVPGNGAAPPGLSTSANPPPAPGAPSAGLPASPPGGMAGWGAKS